MWIYIPCLQCKDEKGIPFWKVSIRDDSTYQITCSNGHIQLIALQQQKFEVLFEMGAYAIIDGYYREAISSFTASLERFYEFYIKVISFKHGITDEQFEESWKLISNQSERQLGAFIYLYSIENKNPPQILSNKDREFRNKVIHRGKIPGKNEAIAYGDVILQLIRPILRDLKLRYNEYVQATVLQHLLRIRREVPVDLKVNTMYISTIISISDEEPGGDSKSLNDALQELVRTRQRFEADFQ